MNTRPYLQGDGAGIDALLDLCWPGDPVLRDLHDLHTASGEDHWRRTLVGEEDGAVVAAGTVRLGARHPTRYWLVLNVAPAWRGRGIGSRLFMELRQLVESDPRPFRVQARPSDTATMHFLQRHGFRPRIETWEGVIDPTDPEVRARLAATNGDLSGFRIVRPDRNNQRILWPALAAFYEDWYHAIHVWDPPSRWPLKRSLEHFCGSALVGGSVVCLFHDERLIGAGSLILPPFDTDKDELYLVQVGVLGLEPDYRRRLTARLVADLLAFAAERGQSIRFEVDSAHEDLWAVIEDLPLVESSRDFAILVSDL